MSTELIARRFLRQAPLPRRRAHIVAAAVIMSLAIISIAGQLAWNRWLAPLPHPEECSREQLLQWIATRDVRQEPATIQLALANQFEQLLMEGSIVHAQQDLKPKYAQRVDDNQETLIQTWLRDRADRVKTLPPHQARSLLDQSLATIIVLCRVAPDQIQSILSRDAARDASGEVIPFIRLAGQRWLETYDVTDLAPSTRSELALVLAETLFRQSPDTLIGKSVRNLDELREDRDDLRQRRHQNLRSLVIAWLRATAVQYAGVAPSEQEAFVATRCEEVSKIQGTLSELATPSSNTTRTESSRPHSESTTPFDASSNFSLASVLQEAVAEADDSSKQPLQNFLGAMQREWLRQTFRWLTR